MSNYFQFISDDLSQEFNKINMTYVFIIYIIICGLGLFRYTFFKKENKIPFWKVQFNILFNIHRIIAMVGVIVGGSLWLMITSKYVIKNQLSIDFFVPDLFDNLFKYLEYKIINMSLTDNLILGFSVIGISIIINYLNLKHEKFYSRLAKIFIYFLVITIGFSFFTLLLWGILSSTGCCVLTIFSIVVIIIAYLEKKDILKQERLL